MTEPTRANLSVMTTLRRLGPYVWHYRTRVVIALLLLVASKVASVGVPVVMSLLVNHLNMKLSVLVVPLLLLAAYGALRVSTSLFQEARQVVFARVLARTSREITLKVFWHLHALSLRFHLDRRTGGVAREVERGMVSVSDLLDWTIYTILPTLLEIAIICTILVMHFD